MRLNYFGTSLLFDGQHAPTAAQIAASIRRSGKHQAAEDRLTALKARSGELHAEIRRLAGERQHGANAAETDRAIARLHTEREQVAAQAAEVRREVVGLRAQHAVKVRTNLRPTIAAAASRAQHALADLRAALGALSEIDAALIAARDPGLDLPVSGLDALAARLAALAG
jgi:predicted  nucleic acid-binding Zn-ribbon protein